MVVTSLKEREELYRVPPIVFPKKAQWQNYVDAWTMIRYQRFFTNSVVISLFYTFPCIMGSCFAGYGFSRFRVKGRNFIFMLMLSTMMIPYMVTMIPLFLLISKIGLDR